MLLLCMTVVALQTNSPPNLTDLPNMIEEEESYKLQPANKITCANHGNNVICA